MFPKLVRDNIPEMIKESGKKSKFRLSEKRELDYFITKKMIEELEEFVETPSLEEAADMYEVFLAMLKNWNLNLVDVKTAASIKRNCNGSFEKGIILEQIYGTNNN